MSCVTRIQQRRVFGIHRPLETKTNSVEKDLIVEKYKSKSSAAFWTLCFQALMFYERCLGTVEVARMWKEQTVQCQEQIMWLRVSLLARHTKSAARLQLEIPTRDIKLETVLHRKQWGRGGRQPPTTAEKLPCSQEGFKKMENQISGWRSKGTLKLHCSPLKTLSWSQLLTMLLCHAACACLQASSGSNCSLIWAPQSCRLCPLPRCFWTAAGTPGTLSAAPSQAKSAGTCCQSPIHTGTRWQRKAKKAWGGFFL